MAYQWADPGNWSLYRVTILLVPLYLQSWFSADTLFWKKAEENSLIVAESEAPVCPDGCNVCSLFHTGPLWSEANRRPEPQWCKAMPCFWRCPKYWLQGFSMAIIPVCWDLTPNIPLYDVICLRGTGTAPPSSWNSSPRLVWSCRSLPLTVRPFLTIVGSWRMAKCLGHNNVS